LTTGAQREHALNKFEDLIRELTELAQEG